MFPRKQAIRWLATLVVLGLFCVSGTATAQVLSKWGHQVITLGETPYDSTNTGHGHYPGGPGFIPGYGYYPGPFPGHYPWMDGPGTPFDRRTIPPAAWGGAAWAPQLEAATIPPDAALLIVKVPAEAEIWINDAKTAQGGSYRQFLTPPLPAAGDLWYTIRARWRIKDAELSRVEEIRVQRSGRFTVNFLTTDSWVGHRVEPNPDRGSVAGNAASTRR
jgi:uncharacterized protein (TIGR03000 family)